MKRLLFIPLLLTGLISSCSLDPGRVVYNNVVIPIDERNVPETGSVNQDVNIYVASSEDNGCWSDIHFVMEQKDDREYEIWALADFESSGVCPEMIVSADSVLTFKPERPGDHIITFRMTPVQFEKDTVAVGESLGDR
jgi:hypothetical protein